MHLKGCVQLLGCTSDLQQSLSGAKSLKDRFAEGVFVVETQGFKAGGPERQLLESFGVALLTGGNLDLTPHVESPDHAGSGFDLQVGKGHGHKRVPLVPAAL